jgi:hypothetical protein
MGRLSLAFLMVTILFTSCKTDEAIVRGSLENRTSQELWNALDDQSSFGTISAKIHVDFEQNGKNQSFNCKLRIKEDSAVWVSIAPLLGIELFRMVITTDSVKLINRLDKRYFTDSLAVLEIMTKVPISFDVLQSLLTGTLVNLHPSNRYRTTRIRDHYQMGMKSRGKLRRTFRRKSMYDVPIAHQMQVARNGKSLINTFLKDLSTGNLVRAKYSEFEMVGEKEFPTDMLITTGGSGRVRIKLEWSKVKMGELVNLPFKIPKKYMPFPNE